MKQLGKSRIHILEYTLQVRQGDPIDGWFGKFLECDPVKAHKIILDGWNRIVENSSVVLSTDQMDCDLPGKRSLQMMHSF